MAQEGGIFIAGKALEGGLGLRLVPGQAGGFGDEEEHERRFAKKFAGTERFGLGGFGLDEAAISLPGAVLASALFAWPTGWVALRARGIGLLMITLAFGQMAFFTAASLSVLGGDDGYTLVAPAVRGPVDVPYNVHAENGRIDVFGIDRFAQNLRAQVRPHFLGGEASGETE